MNRLRKTVNFRRLSLRVFPLALYRVAGQSMRPALTEGQLLVAWRWARPKAGRVVVANWGRPLVKRVSQMDGRGAWLLGDNTAASIDSRQFGYVQVQNIEAVVIWPRCHAAA